MVKKEKMGKVLKKAARMIPGIGSYQDKESLREADKELRNRLAHRLDEHLGTVEWLKVSLAKMGAYGQMDQLEALTRHLEKISRTLEMDARGYAPLFSETPVDENTLERLYEHDQGLWELISILDSAIQSICADRTVPKGEEVDHVRNLLRSIEKKVSERAQVLKNRP